MHKSSAPSTAIATKNVAADIITTPLHDVKFIVFDSPTNLELSHLIIEPRALILCQSHANTHRASNH